MVAGDHQQLHPGLAARADGGRRLMPGRVHEGDEPREAEVRRGQCRHTVEGVEGGWHIQSEKYEMKFVDACCIGHFIVYFLFVMNYFISYLFSIREYNLILTKFLSIYLNIHK